MIPGCILPRIGNCTQDAGPCRPTSQERRVALLGAWTWRASVVTKGHSPLEHEWLALGLHVVNATSEQPIIFSNVQLVDMSVLHTAQSETAPFKLEVMLQDWLANFYSIQEIIAMPVCYRGMSQSFRFLQQVRGLWAPTQKSTPSFGDHIIANDKTT